MKSFKTNIGCCMSETEPDVGFIDAVAVHLFVIEKDKIPSASTDMFFFVGKPKGNM